MIKGDKGTALGFASSQLQTDRNSSPFAPPFFLNKNKFIHFIKLFLQIHKSSYLNFKPTKAIIRPKKDEK
ncbi:hypothetical protein [Campylobacter concisus]|uniref:hypothetical protein n=1 Tax=Campylobacter concisus TaxID=199 RepID=UPI000CD8D38D|nr:hypothetical protein [Campylobacter concisus]